MDPEDPVAAAQYFGGSNRGPGVRAGVADQSRQTARGAVAAMGAGDGAHGLRRWPVIEKNATAAVDLQVNEAGRQQRPGRHHFDRPLPRALTTRRDALNHPAIDHEKRIIVPSLSIENTVSRNGELGSLDVLSGLQTHRLASLPAVV